LAALTSLLPQPIYSRDLGLTLLLLCVAWARAHVQVLPGKTWGASRGTGWGGVWHRQGV